MKTAVQLVHFIIITVTGVLFIAVEHHKQNSISFHCTGKKMGKNKMRYFKT